MNHEVSRNYDRLYIIDSRNEQNKIRQSIDLNKDLILSFDFGLVQEITKHGGESEYLDNICDIDTMQVNEKIVHDFLKKWYLDENGLDMFQFKGIYFGNSFNENISYKIMQIVKMTLTLERIRQIKYKELFVLSKNDLLHTLLKYLELEYNCVDISRARKKFHNYYFPINEWMSDKLHPKLMMRIKQFLYKFLSLLVNFINNRFRYLAKRSETHTIFFQRYFPTYPIISQLNKVKQLDLLLENFSSPKQMLKTTNEIILPFNYIREGVSKSVFQNLSNFESKKKNKLILFNTKDISDIIYEVIYDTLKTNIYNHIKILSSCIRYCQRNRLDLIVLIANVGLIPTLLHAVCKMQKIPSYLVINGILLDKNDAESKDATFINSYSESIKRNYFANQNNIRVLGDPRMDLYSNIPRRLPNREFPQIVIGASAFRPISLSSYLAVEFDFMFKILKALSDLKQEDHNFKVKLKLRSNNYNAQYRKFLKEYFGTLRVEIINNLPMNKVLRACDFYISTCSQTIFESASLGIPSVYFKNDKSILHEPFNWSSDLVTVDSSEGFKQAFLDFKESHPKFDRLLDRENLEYYVGSIDGNNTKRNIDFIFNLINFSQKPC